MSTLVSKCQQSLSYEEIYEILEHRTCASSSDRIRRGTDDTNDEQTVASTNNIYALQSTINDHRTMIDDHRKMIYYLMNNTVNITQLSQHYTDEHSRRAPIWQSWRDVALLLLLVIFLTIGICFVIQRLRLLDLLTMALLRRQHHKRSGVKRQPTKPVTFSVEPMSISNVTRDYLRHQYNSNDSL